MRAGIPAAHKSASAPATPLPHAGEGAGAPRAHHPTHAGRDARGPQIGTCPSPSRGMKSVGWARITLPSPVAVGGTRGGWGPREWKPHPCHNTPLPHPCGQGYRQPTNRHLPPPHHCPMPARAPALPGTPTNACWRMRSHGPTTDPCKQGCPRTTDHRGPRNTPKVAKLPVARQYAVGGLARVKGGGVLQ